MSRATAAVLALLLLTTAPASAHAQEPARPTYAGRPLAEVLRDLDRRGLRVVFSTRLVRPAMRVGAEPPGPSLRAMLDQILAPHGLAARQGPGGRLVVAHAASVRAAPTIAPHGTVSGQVVDAETGAPLADVLVVPQGTDLRAVTDRDGRFELADLPIGRHALFVSLVGYVLARPTVEVLGGTTVPLAVPLTAGTGAYTEQLTVRGTGTTATTAAAPVEFRVRSADLQELRGVLEDDPFRALQSMPGVATGDDFRAEFSVRGSDFRQVGFAVDGIAAPWLVHGARAVEDTATVAMINTDVIDEVTLTSGAGPQPFGNRSGAWVQSAIREGSRDAFRMTGALSFTGASAVVEGPIGHARRGSWLASVRQSYIDWLIRRIDTQADTTFGFTDGQAKVAFDLTPRHRLEVTAIGGRSRFDEHDESPGPNGLHDGTSATGLVIGGWRATLGDRTVATWRTAWSGVRYRNRSDFGDELAAGREWLGTSRLDVSHGLTGALTLDAGTSVDVEWATFRRRRYVLAAPATAELRSWTTWQRDRVRSGAYGRGRWTPRAALAIDAGARVDHDGATGDTTASPWLLARWSPAAPWSLAAGAGLVHQAPDLAMLSPDGTPDPVGAERARALDVSGEVRLSPALRLQAAVYDRREREGLRLDALEARLVDGVVAAPFASELWRNSTRTSSRGAELVLRRSAAQGLVGWVAYGYGRTRVTDVASGETWWGDFDQRHQLNVHASYRFGTRTTATAKFRYGSNFPVLGYFDAGPQDTFVLSAKRNETRLPAYARLDLRLNRTYNYAHRRLTLFAEVLNVLGRENVGRTDGNVRGTGQVSGFVETLLPRLPSLGIRVEF